MSLLDTWSRNCVDIAPQDLERREFRNARNPPTVSRRH
jgi:hypothetical protein